MNASLLAPTGQPDQKGQIQCSWKQECNCFREGCPDAEMTTSSLHLKARVAGFTFDIALQDNLAEPCVTLSRIFQEQCNGLSLHSFSKNAHFGALSFTFTLLAQYENWSIASCTHILTSVSGRMSVAQVWYLTNSFWTAREAQLKE